jgi:hypothetical protein
MVAGLPGNLSMMKSEFKTFSTFGVFGGIFSLIWLFTLPSDPKTAWFLGYSPSRWALIVASLAGISLFAGLYLSITKNLTWVNRASESLQHRLEDEFWGTVLLGILTSVLLITVTLLSVTFIEFGTWIDKPYRSIVVLTQVYLVRFFPILVWLALLSLTGIVLLTRLGFANHVRWFRICAILLFLYSYVLFEILMRVNEGISRMIAHEDNFIEWATVVFMVLAAIISWIKAFQARKTGNPYIWFFILFGIASMLFALEELNWGQRIIGFETTEFFLEKSDQPVINVHNVINRQFHVRTKHVAAWALIIYGVLLPLAARQRRIRLLIERFRLLLPPLILAFGFLFSAFLTTDRFFGGRVEELAELLLSIGLFMSILWEYIKPYWPEHQISGDQIVSESA